MNVKEIYQYVNKSVKTNLVKKESTLVHVKLVFNLHLIITHVMV